MDDNEGNWRSALACDELCCVGDDATCAQFDLKITKPKKIVPKKKQKNVKEASIDISTIYTLLPTQHLARRVKKAAAATSREPRLFTTVRAFRYTPHLQLSPDLNPSRRLSRRFFSSDVVFTSPRRPRHKKFRRGR